jgi:hypothetical protein
MRIVSALLATAVLLAGCSLLESGAGGGGAAGGGAAGGDPDKPIAGGGGGGEPPAPAAAARQEPDPTIVDLRPAAIDRFAIGPDGRTLVIMYWGGTPACFGLHDVLLEVQDGTPIVTVLEGTRPEAVGQPCSMEALLKSAVVTLPDALLIDGSGADHPAGEPPADLAPLAVAIAPAIVDAQPRAVQGYLLSADGLRLTVVYVGGVEVCYGTADVSVEPVDGALRVTVFEGRRQGVDATCEDLGVVKGVDVALPAPLIVQAAFDN